MRCIDAAVITLLLAICVIMACYIAMQATAAGGAATGGRAGEPAAKTPARSPHRLRFPRHIVEYGARHRTRDVDYATLEMAPTDLKGHSPTVYSSLMPWHVAGAKRVLLEELAEAPATILDASAHVGVDSTLLLSLFPKANLTAVEIDPATAAVTARNLARAGARARVLVGDGAARVAAGPATDLLYLDPPWGGAGAAARAAAPALSLGGVPLPSLVAAALDAGYGRVVVKLPRDTDTAAFVAAAAAAATNAAAAAASGARDKITGRVRPVCDARRPADCETHPGYWLAFFTKLAA